MAVEQLAELWKPKRTERPALDAEIQSIRNLLARADRQFFDDVATEYWRTREPIAIEYVPYPAWLWPQLEKAEEDVIRAGWSAGKENLRRRVMRNEPPRIFAAGGGLPPIPPEARGAILIAEQTVYPTEAIDRFTENRIPPLRHDISLRRRVLARDIVTERIGEGQGVRGIMDGLRDDGFGRSEWHREVIARTETAVLFEHGKQAEYVSSPSTTGWLFVAVMDSRTTVTCEYMDGRRFRKDDADGVTPPLHFACRSTTEPIFIFDEQPEWATSRGVLDGAAPDERPLRGFGEVDYGTMPSAGRPADLYRVLNESESAVVRGYAAELEERLAWVRGAGPKPAAVGDEYTWTAEERQDMAEWVEGLKKGYIPRESIERDIQTWKDELIDAIEYADAEAEAIARRELARVEAILKEATDSPEMAWSNLLTTEERSAVQSWTKGQWEEMQAVSRTGEGSAEAEELYGQFEAALNKGTPAEGSVYRGLHELSEKAYDELAQIKTIELDAVQSATRSVSVADEFVIGPVSADIAEVGFEPGMVLRGARFEIIENKSGIELMALSDHPEELEVILRKGTRYRVIDITENTKTLGNLTIKSHRIRIEEL